MKQKVLTLKLETLAYGQMYQFFLMQRLDLWYKVTEHCHVYGYGRGLSICTMTAHRKSYIEMSRRTTSCWT